MNYLDNILLHCPKAVKLEESDFAVPHQSISPREILQNWVRNDSDTAVHEPVVDWHGGDIHPNSIREFEDDFEAMEYLADLTSKPVSIDSVGNPVESDPVDSHETTSTAE